MALVTGVLTETHTEGIYHITMDAETEVVCLQAREGQGPLATPEAGRSKRGSSRASRECKTSPGLLASSTVREQIPRVCVCF